MNATDQDPFENDSASLKRRRTQIQSLLDSQGWAILREAMEKDLHEATRQLAADPEMSDTQMHYRRGAIHAAVQMMAAPVSLLRQLDVAIRFAEQQEQVATRMAHKDDPRA